MLFNHFINCWSKKFFSTSFLSVFCNLLSLLLEKNMLHVLFAVHYPQVIKQKVYLFLESLVKSSNLNIGFTFLLTLLIDILVSWCSGYHYCTTSFNKAWTHALRRFKSCSRRVGDLSWWESLTMIPTGNKAKRLSSVNHTTKIIHSFKTGF